MNVADAAASGNRLALLLAMRERVALAISDPDCPQRDLSSLCRRLMDIAKEIGELQERIRQENEERNGDHSTEWSIDTV